MGLARRASQYAVIFLPHASSGRNRFFDGPQGREGSTHPRRPGTQGGRTHTGYRPDGQRGVHVLGTNYFFSRTTLVCLTIPRVVLS